MKLKKCLLVSSFLGLIVITTACSSADENTVVIVDEETGEERLVERSIVEQQEQEKTAYSEHLSSTFNTTIGLHDTFAHSLDKLFTKEVQVSQFAKILRDSVIEQSREALDAAEKYNFPVDYFELNQMVVANLNNQHQLFLDAVNEATVASDSENQKMDIVKLRERLTELKQEYLTIVNIWKNGGEVQ